jgi:hypothetical protein
MPGQISNYIVTPPPVFPILAGVSATIGSVRVGTVGGAGNTTGPYRVDCDFEIVDAAGTIATISLRIIVSGGNAPVQVGGTETPSALHTNMVSPPSAITLTVNPGTKNVDAVVTNSAAGNPLRARATFTVAFLLSPGAP